MKKYETHIRRPSSFSLRMLAEILFVASLATGMSVLLISTLFTIGSIVLGLLGIVT